MLERAVVADAAAEQQKRVEFGLAMWQLLGEEDEVYYLAR